MQIKTTLRFHITQSEWLKSKKNNWHQMLVSTWGKGREKLLQFWWDCRLGSHSRKQFGTFLKTKIRSTNTSHTTFVFGYVPKEFYILPTEICSVIYLLLYLQQLASGSNLNVFSWFTANENVINIFNGIILSCKENWNNEICRKIDGISKYYTEWDNTDLERQTLCVFSYLWILDPNLQVQTCNLE